MHLKNVWWEGVNWIHLVQRKGTLWTLWTW